VEGLSLFGTVASSIAFTCLLPIILAEPDRAALKSERLRLRQPFLKMEEID
jgi:hypothetical protein